MNFIPVSIFLELTKQKTKKVRVKKNDWRRYGVEFEAIGAEMVTKQSPCGYVIRTSAQRRLNGKLGLRSIKTNSVEAPLAARL